MGLGGSSGTPGGLGSLLSGLRLAWLMAELRARALLPGPEETPDLLELLDRKVQGKPLAGEARRRKVEVEQQGDGTELLKVRQVAKLLGVSEKTVRRMIAKEELPFVPVRGAVRVRRRSVDRWVSAREEGR